MKKIVKAALATLFACSMTLNLTACGLFEDSDKPTADPPSVDTPIPNPTEIIMKQELDYTESTDPVYNPDQGFYLPITVKVTPGGITYNKSIIGGAKLYHLRMDISAFSSAAGGTDSPLTSAALGGIKDLVQYLREHDKNAIIRFCYAPDFGDRANCEPSLSAMVNHIEQFCAVLNRFSATITAFEVGMVGPWGEMHTSEIVKDPATISTLITAFLTYTTDIPVLVRTPKMIYNYLELPDHMDTYRLGMFNDGYLGTDTDIGTYQNREEDIAFIGGQTEHLPFGGEVTVPESTLHNIEICLPEMYSIHLSYLNEQWNDQVVAKWKKTTVTENCASADPLYYGKTAYEYIRNHMGYRFVLKDSVFTYTDSYDNLGITLTLSNVGFGNLNKSKKAKLLFVNDKTDAVTEKVAGNFDGGSTVKYSVPLDLAKGRYEVYLRIYGDEWNGAPRYTLQFANDGIYHTSLNANRIGTIEIA